MLFDEKELNVLDNNESRTYFKEILQSYYSQNYRATIVLLYSFVIYDLFIKLQTMARRCMTILQSICVTAMPFIALPITRSDGRKI